MKVFISWSGEQSKQVAELLRDWIPNVLQFVEPWVSFDNIKKGEIWFGSLSKGLAEIKFGIVCVTRDNLEARWIHFESGALSGKGLPDTFVCPLLVNLKNEEVDAALSKFNMTTCSQIDIFRLVK